MTEKTKHYLSYSRAFTFHYDFYGFIRKYIFKEVSKEKEKENIFKEIHRALNNSFNFKEDEIGFFRGTGKIGILKSDLPELEEMKKTKKFVIEKQQVFDTYKSFNRHIHLNSNKDLLEIFRLKDFEKEIYSDKINMRGELDVFCPHKIVEIKGISKSVFLRSSARYGLQQASYQQIIRAQTNKNIDFEFLLINYTYPNDFHRIKLPDSFIESCIDRLNSINKEYQNILNTIKDILKREDIFDCPLNESEKKNLLEKLIEKKYIKNVEVLVPMSWHYSEVEGGI